MLSCKEIENSGCILCIPCSSAFKLLHSACMNSSTRIKHVKGMREGMKEEMCRNRSTSYVHETHLEKPNGEASIRASSMHKRACNVELENLGEYIRDDVHCVRAYMLDGARARG